MIPVLETAPDVFTRNIPAGITSKDGTRRVPLEVVLHESWTAADRAEFGIYLVEPAAAIPAHHRIVSTSYVRGVDGVVRQQHVTELTVPVQVRNIQLRRAIRKVGKKPQVDVHLATLTEDVIEEWDYADPIHRNHPLVVQTGLNLGWSVQELDDLFRLAATL